MKIRNLDRYCADELFGDISYRYPKTLEEIIEYYRYNECIEQYIRFRAYKIERLWTMTPPAPPASDIHLDQIVEKARLEREWRNRPRKHRPRSRTPVHRKTKAEKVEVLMKYALPVRDYTHKSLCIHEAKILGENEDFVPHRKDIALFFLHTKCVISHYNPYVRYNVPLQIRTSKQYTVSNCNETQKVVTNLYLSAAVANVDFVETRRQKREPLIIDKGSPATFSHHRCRVRRNVFCFERYPVLENSPNTAICYYQNVFIRLYNTGPYTTGHLYLRCQEKPYPDIVGKDRNRVLVLTFSDRLDRNCIFQIVPTHSMQTKDGPEDKIIPTFKSILIRHALTQRFLLCYGNLFNGCPVVGRELKACCVTYRELDNPVTCHNYFTVVSSTTLEKRMKHNHERPGEDL